MYVTANLQTAGHHIMLITEKLCPNRAFPNIAKLMLVSGSNPIYLSN